MAQANRTRVQLRMTPRLKQHLRNALKEDIGPGDVTTERTVRKGLKATGELMAKAPGILCGAPVAQWVWRSTALASRIHWNVHDGDEVRPGETIATVEGGARGLLNGERVALNFLQRLSGIATLTARYHQAAGGSAGPLICDTRKTTPLWRELERYAVRVGGGTNHRFGLFDMVLIKENHARAAGGLREAIQLALKGGRKLRVMAEARNEQEAQICWEERVDMIMLDNFTPARARRVIERYRATGIPFEISGGVTPRNIAAFAATGADRISIGALTHSAPALDLSFQLRPHS